MFPKYLYHSTTLTMHTYFDLQGINIREPIAVILHKTKLATFVHSRHDVKELKCRQLSTFVYLLTIKWLIVKYLRCRYKILKYQNIKSSLTMDIGLIIDDN
jgi:hypothetical protein